jgi:hypothetical protein
MILSAESCPVLGASSCPASNGRIPANEPSVRGPENAEVAISSHRGPAIELASERSPDLASPHRPAKRARSQPRESVGGKAPDIAAPVGLAQDPPSAKTRRTRQPGSYAESPATRSPRRRDADTRTESEIRRARSPGRSARPATRTPFGRARTDSRARTAGRATAAGRASTASELERASYRGTPTRESSGVRPPRTPSWDPPPRVAGVRSVHDEAGSSPFHPSVFAFETYDQRMVVPARSLGGDTMPGQAN